MLAWGVLVAGLLCSAVTWAVDGQTVEQKAAAAIPAEPAELKIANRTVLTFRGTLLGETPALRAQRARTVIGEALEGDGDLKVSIDPIQQSYLVLLGYSRAFIVTPQDLAADQTSVREAAEAAAENLRLVVEESGEARNVRFLSRPRAIRPSRPCCTSPCCGAPASCAAACSI